MTLTKTRERALDQLFASPEDPEESDMRGRLKTSTAVRDYVLAGNATVTLRSVKSGTRYTYKIQTPKGKPNPWFVKVMYGPDNEADFAFLGTIFEDGSYRHSQKSVIKEADRRAQGWRWTWWKIADGKDLPDDLEVWHEGRCGRCGRKLTVPSSVERGIGPECAGKMGE